MFKIMVQTIWEQCIVKKVKKERKEYEINKTLNPYIIFTVKNKTSSIIAIKNPNE